MYVVYLCLASGVEAQDDGRKKRGDQLEAIMVVVVGRLRLSSNCNASLAVDGGIQRGMEFFSWVVGDVRTARMIQSK